MGWPGGSFAGSSGSWPEIHLDGGPERNIGQAQKGFRGCRGDHRLRKVGNNVHLFVAADQAVEYQGVEMFGIRVRADSWIKADGHGLHQKIDCRSVVRLAPSPASGKTRDHQNRPRKRHPSPVIGPLYCPPKSPGILMSRDFPVRGKIWSCRSLLWPKRSVPSATGAADVSPIRMDWEAHPPFRAP